MKYDITFKCANGTYKLEECKRIPSHEDVEDSIKDFDGVGLGKLNQIIIDVKE